MARTTVTLSDKIAKAVEGELTNSEQAYFDWIVEQAEAQGVVVKLDATTFKLARGMYNDYIADPDVAAANERRRKENEAKKNERKNKAIERAKALLAAEGLAVVAAEDDDDSDDDDDDNE